MSDQEIVQETGERKLRPASENVWYALATIAGEPKGDHDREIIEQNRHYWNGYMRSLLSDADYQNSRREIEDSTGKRFSLPSLTDIELRDIRESINKRGFSKEGLPSGQINFGNVLFPHVVFSGFVFVNKADFSESTFTEYAYFEDVYFLNTAYFIESKGRYLKDAIF